MAFSVSYIYRIVDRYSQPLKRITKATSDFRRKTALASKTTLRMTDRVESLSRNLPTLQSRFGRSGMSAFATRTHRTASEVRDLNKALNASATSAQRQEHAFASSVSKTSSRVSRMGGRFKSAGESMASFGGIAGSAISMIGGAAATQKFLSFESAMNAAMGTTGATADEFKQLTALARELGETTSFSAGQAASAIDMLGRNGLKAKQIMNGAAKATIDLAAATGTDLPNAANIATDVMANFGKKASELPGIMDRITGVTINSKFNIDDYRLALAQAGGVAGAVGVSLDDFNTSIAAMAPLFASGSDAGTSFKTFLQRLVPASKEAEKLMKELGLKFFDSAGKMKSMAEISDQLRKAFSGLSEEQKNNAASTLFGTDAMRTALGLAKVSEKQFKQLAGKINEVTAAGMAGMRLKGLGGVLKKLKSAVEGLILTFFIEGGIAEILTTIAEKAMGAVRVLRKFSPTFFKIAGIAILVAGGLAVVIAPVGILASIIGAAIPVFASLGTAIGAISMPIVVAVAGITAAVLWIGGMIKNSAMLRQSLMNLLDAFSPVTDGLKMFVLWIGDKMGMALSGSDAGFKAWGDAVAVVINFIAGLVRGLFDRIGSASTALAALAHGDFKGALEAGKAVIIGQEAATKKAAKDSMGLNVSGGITVKAMPHTEIEEANIGLDTGYNFGQL